MKAIRPDLERCEGGFTLVEVLVAIVIEAMIVSALGMAFIGILKSVPQVNQSLTQSGDARISAAYIVSDARNSSGPEISLADTTSCADASPPVAGTQSPVVRFDWSSTSSAGTTTPIIVMYYLVSNHLVRRECKNGTLVSDRVVASSVASVTVACAPTADCSGVPTSVTVTITETAASNGAQYQYSLTGTFHKPIGGAPSSLILLGSGGSCSTGATGINLASSASMRVYGNARINTTDGSTCNAMDVNSATYQAGGTQILTGGTCAASNGGVCPTATSYHSALADPYGGLAAPSTNGLPARSDCAGGVALPGVYASTLTISAACQLASGVYIFQNGLQITSTGALTSAAGGVLVYIAGGRLGVSNAASVTLSAQASGPYAGVVIWQPASNANTDFNLEGSLALGGVIYAPTDDVRLSSALHNPTVGGIVARTISVSNSGTLTIGTASATPLSISSPAVLPAWTVNRPYPSTTIAPAGGDGKYNWSASGLPAGLTINASTGVISGTPTVAGASSVTVTVNDALGDTPATANYALTINAAPTVSTASLPNGTITTAYAGVTMATTGGTTPFSTWTATGLPAGLSINSATGTISGTPTASGTFSSVVVSATDAAGATATHAAYSLTINPRATVASTSPTSRPQGATSQVIAITGTGFINGAPLAATFSGTGITVNSTTWVSATTVNANITITGAATTGARTVTVTNGDGVAATGSATFTVNATPTITTVAPATYTKNIAGLSVTITGTGFVSGAVVSLTATAGTAPTITSTTWNSSTSIKIVLTVPNATSTNNITITNPDGGTITKTAGFTAT